jgi:hypothetical protein
MTVAPPASLLVTRGAIHTLWPERPSAEAMLLERGQVTWLGRSAQAPQADQVLDLGGRTVLPGLIDAHCHPYWMAQDRLQLNVAAPEIRNIPDLLELLRSQMARLDGSEWLVGRGLNEFRLSERRLPQRWDLDRISARQPIVLKRVCGHAVVANSAALQAIGVQARTPDPFGGVIEREQGEPNGILRERAAEPLLRLVPTPPTEDLGRSLRAVAASFLACGVTGITEAAVGFASSFSREWEVWNAVRHQGVFPLRMTFMLRITPAAAHALGAQPTGIDLDWQADTLKFFVDGTVGSRSAAVSDPYEGSLCRCGLFMQPPEQLSTEVWAAVEAGWHIAVHAIGDRAIDTTAEVFEQVRGRQSSDVRLRVEHLALPTEPSLQRLAQSRAVIVPQYAFLHELGDGFLAALGQARASRLYPGRSLIAGGLTVAGSSDAPAASCSPFAAMSAAMTRTTVAGETLNAAERVTAQEAVSMYTTGAAKALGHENVRGVLRPGAVADAIILDRDPLLATAQEMLHTRVEATIVRGVVAHENWLNR